jgi:alpha-L-fucosidase
MRERHEVYLITEIPCVIVLTPETYYKIKISSPEEIINRSIERNYKRPLKNSYMIFMIDCSETFKVKKKKKKNRENYFSLLWNIASEKVRDEYTKVFEDYKRLRPNIVAFRQTDEGQDNSSNQPSDNTNDLEAEYNRLFDEFIDMPITDSM